MDQERRTFLKAMVATTAVAAAGGAGIALVADYLNEQERKDQPIVMAVHDSATVAAIPAVTAVAGSTQIGDNSELVRQIAALQAENSRLQQELTTAQARIVELEGGSADSQQQRAQLQTDLDSATGKMGVMAGLLTLYEKLELDELPQLVTGGLAQMGSAVTSLLDGGPALTQSVEVSKSALNQFEQEIPVVYVGRNWLANHLMTLSSAHQGVESAVAAAVEVTGSFLDLLVTWFESVIKWLPFGLGEKSRQIMHAMRDLFSQTPVTVAGSNANLFEPLKIWFGSVDDDDVPLVRNLVAPLKEQLIQSAELTLAQLPTLQTTFQTELSNPTTNALAQRQALVSEIQAYRQEHQL